MSKDSEIVDFAKELFVQDISFRKISEQIQAKFEKSVSHATVKKWSIANHWQKTKEDTFKDAITKVQAKDLKEKKTKTTKDKLPEKATEKTTEKIPENPPDKIAPFGDPKDLIAVEAIESRYKEALELRNLSLKIINEALTKPSGEIKPKIGNDKIPASFLAKHGIDLFKASSAELKELEANLKVFRDALKKDINESENQSSTWFDEIEDKL